MTEAAPAVVNARPAVWRRWQLWVGLAMLVIAVFSLRGRIPNFTDIGAALRSADLRWVWAAAAAEAASMAMFARQQRTLLAALDVDMSLPRAIAVTYARSAIAISMPAGSAVSAGFAFQQYRRSGASREHAAAVMVLSGLISFFGLAALYAAGGLGFLVFAPSATWHGKGALQITVAAGLLIGAVIAFAAWRRGRSHSSTPKAERSLSVSTATASVGTLPRAKATLATSIPAEVGLGEALSREGTLGAAPRHEATLAAASSARAASSPGCVATLAAPRRIISSPVPSPLRAPALKAPTTRNATAKAQVTHGAAKPEPAAVTAPAGPIARRMAAIRAAASQSVTAWHTLRPRHWMVAGLYAVGNWLLDLLCLAASARAFNLPVSLAALAGIYVGVQLVRQIPLTPGGIGLIETGLLAGLAAAHAPAAHAAAAVLTYRILSCWLIIPIGGVAALGLRRPTPTAASQ